MIARTTLITWIFLSPAPVRTTSNAVCSSAAPSPPAAGSRRRSSDRDRSGSGDAPLVLDLLLQLDELEHGHLPELVEQLVDSCSRHCYSSSFGCSVAASCVAGSVSDVSSATASSAADSAATGSSAGSLGRRLLGLGASCGSDPSGVALLPRAARCGRRSGRPGRAAAREISPTTVVSGAVIAPSTCPRQDVERRQRREVLDVLLADRRAVEDAAADREDLGRSRRVGERLRDARPCRRRPRGRRSPSGLRAARAARRRRPPRPRAASACS